jgi:hypothetical protein
MIKFRNLTSYWEHTSFRFELGPLERGEVYSWPPRILSSEKFDPLDFSIEKD